MPWPKGMPHSAETRKKISLAGKGKRKGANNPYWKGGKSTDTSGYIIVLAREHPNVMSNGYVKEHRLVMERHLGRLLGTDEHVHHKNGDITDNRLSNLELTTAGKHQNIHHCGAKRSAESKKKMSEKATAFYRTAAGREIQRQRALAAAAKRRGEI